MHESGEPPIPAEPQDAVLVPVKRRFPMGLDTRQFPESVDHPMIEHILEGIRSGTIGFKQACADAGVLDTAVRMWAVRDNPPGFRALYREARRIEMDAFADAIVETAEGVNREGRDTAGAVYRDQLGINTKKWLMERRAAMDFGDRGTVDEEGKSIAKQKIVIGNMEISF